MPKRFLNLVTLLLLVVAGVVGQSEARPSSNDLTLADLYSFANTESNTEQGNTGTTPSDPWNYISDRYLTVSAEYLTQVCTSDSYITVRERTYYGDYRKGHTYGVTIYIYRCGGKQEGCWCPQKDREELIEAKDLEKGA